MSAPCCTQPAAVAYVNTSSTFEVVTYTILIAVVPLLAAQEIPSRGNISGEEMAISIRYLAVRQNCSA